MVAAQLLISHLLFPSMLHSLFLSKKATQKRGCEGCS